MLVWRKEIVMTSFGNFNLQSGIVSCTISDTIIGLKFIIQHVYNIISVNLLFYMDSLPHAMLSFMTEDCHALMAACSEF